MSDWRTIYPDVDGRPVRANPARFREEAHKGIDAARRLDEIRREFRILSGPKNERFRGEAARGLAATMAEVQRSLDRVPPVFRDLAMVMRRHASDLEWLQRDAAFALARARTHWNERNRAANREREQAGIAERAVQRRDAAQQQINHWRRELACMPPEHAGLPTAIFRLERSQDEHRRATNEARAAGEARDRAARSRKKATSELEYWRRGKRNNRSWRGLRRREDDLNEETAKRIKKLDLGTLKDPSKLERLFPRVAAFAREFVEDWREMASAWVRGDVVTFRLKLRDVVKKIALVAVIVVAVIVVAVVTHIYGPAVLAAILLAYKAFTTAKFVVEAADLVGTIIGAALYERDAARRGVVPPESLDEITAAELDQASLKMQLIATLHPTAGSPILDRLRKDFEPRPPLLKAPDIPRILSPEALIEDQRSQVRQGPPSELRPVTPYLCAA